MPVTLRGRREKVFGPGRAVPLDRNAKARIEAYVKGYNARTKQRASTAGRLLRPFSAVFRRRPRWCGDIARVRRVRDRRGLGRLREPGAGEGILTKRVPNRSRLPSPRRQVVKSGSRVSLDRKCRHIKGT